jgi:GDP-4-dehydro-6-deoxy-D-mannose reductase
VRAFLTGASGFIAGHLAEHLRACGDEVVEDSTDVLDRDALTDRIGAESPDVIFHLAAISSSAEGEKDPVRTVRVNVTGTMHVLEAVRAGAPRARVVVFSTGQIYAGADAPLCEDARIGPEGAYAISKATVDWIAPVLARGWNLDLVVLRPFYNVGPRQRAQFALADWAAQLAAGAEQLQTGVLDVERDLMDVRDAVRAYRLAALEGEPGAVYNVCAGRALLLRRVLEDLIALSGRRVRVIEDPSRGGRQHARRVVGCAHRLRERTGWVPEIPWDQTLRTIWESAVSR